MSVNFPVVPVVPGVPPVSRRNNLVNAGISLLTDDVISALIGPKIRWGIFIGGKIALNTDSVVAFDFQKEWNISDYPIAPNDFESYNKVEDPYDVRLLVTKSGNDAVRATFLSQLETISKSLLLYDVVTSDRTYNNANIVRYDYRRDSKNGVSMITAQIVLREVRTKVVQTFSKTAAPAGAAQINNGVQQPKTVPGVGAKAKTEPLIDNLPGFSKPLLKYTDLGFQ